MTASSVFAVLAFLKNKSYVAIANAADFASMTFFLIKSTFTLISLNLVSASCLSVTSRFLTSIILSSNNFIFAAVSSVLRAAVIAGTEAADSLFKRFSAAMRSAGGSGELPSNSLNAFTSSLIVSLIPFSVSGPSSGPPSGPPSGLSSEPSSPSVLLFFVGGRPSSFSCPAVE